VLLSSSSCLPPTIVLATMLANDSSSPTSLLKR
jgi:hypothetical protein